MAGTTDLEQAVAEREAAWHSLDFLLRNLPECEHVAQWRAGCEAARQAHLTAARKAERLEAEARRA